MCLLGGSAHPGFHLTVTYFFSLFVKRLNFDQDQADPELGMPDDSQGFKALVHHSL